MSLHLPGPRKRDRRLTLRRGRGPPSLKWARGQRDPGLAMAGDAVHGYAAVQELVLFCPHQPRLGGLGGFAQRFSHRVQ
jgi:hypothetical protein